MTEEIRAIPEIGSCWTHRKGAEYMVLGITSEPEPHKAEKFPRTVYYMAQADGRCWTRTLKSWYGSFTFARSATKLVADFRDGITS